MTYVYQCPTCRNTFEVIKPVRDMDVNESCPKCGEFGERKFVPENLFLSKTAVTHAEFNPGLGCVVKNEAHKRDLLKAKGMVEVGNDFSSGEKMQSQFDKDREAKKNKRYEEAL